MEPLNEISPKINEKVIFEYFYLKRITRIVIDFITSLIGLFIPSKPGTECIPPITDELLLQPANVIANKIRSGRIKSEQVVQAYIDRIKLVDPLINSVVDERFEHAINEAKELDKQIVQELERVNLDQAQSELLSKPLLGVPFTGKDSIAINGLYQTCGMFCRKGRRAEIDAQVTSYLKNIGGCIPIALTNVPEFCFWFDSQNTIFGRTNNPHDLSRIPGGSSGGQAAVISYAGSLIGVGSDIGGSIRMPSMFCGIFGHKPTPGIVSTHGHEPPIMPEHERLLSFGPMTRYASDLIPMFKVMAGGDKAIKKYLPKIDGKINFKNINIYWMDDNGGDPLTTPVDIEIKTAIQNVAKHFKEKYETNVSKVSFPSLSESFDIFVENFKIENEPSFASQLVEEKHEPNMWIELIKKCFGNSKFTWPMIILSIFDSQNNQINQTTKEYVAKADKLRKDMIDMFETKHDANNEGSIFLYPTHPEVALKHHTTISKANNTSYTSVFNILGIPVTQVPLGLNREGLPIGIQIVATPFCDHLTLAAAVELEMNFGGWVPPCKIDVKV